MENKFQYIHTLQIDEISGGDNEFKKELIGIMLDQLPEFAKNIENFHHDGEWEKLAREAHTAKSSALTFGMEKAGGLLKSIQLDAENKKTKTLPDLIKQVLLEFNAAIPELEELRSLL